jgi:hypothetical protein
VAELKTKKTGASVEQFIEGISDKQRRKDCFDVIDLMKEATKAEPKMWGPAIVGFGDYHYKYESGREADWFLVGFSPRKQNLTLYILPYLERYPELLKTLGKYKTGKSCLYVKTLDDLHLPTLKKLLKQAIADLKKMGAEQRA